MHGDFLNKLTRKIHAEHLVRSNLTYSSAFPWLGVGLAQGELKNKKTNQEIIKKLRKGNQGLIVCILTLTLSFCF